MSLPSWYRLALASALAGASLAPLTGSVAASGDDGADAVVVESAGDLATAVEIPPAPTLGATADTTTNIDVAIGPDGSYVRFGLSLTASTEVDELTSTGDYIVTGTFADVTLTSAGAPGSAGDFASLAGAEFRQTFAGDGAMVDAELLGGASSTAAQRGAFESVLGNLRGARTIYPSEPVGVGARWSVEQSVSGESFPVTASYHYELTAIEDGRYTVSVSYHDTFDTVAEGIAATGTVAGLGSIHGSVDDPLDVSYTLGQTTTTSTGATTFDVAVTVKIESVPGRPSTASP